MSLTKVLTEGATQEYLKQAQESGHFICIPAGSLVWISRDERLPTGDTLVLMPAKVVSTISSVPDEVEGYGKLKIKQGDRVEEILVEEKMLSSIIPMGKENLQKLVSIPLEHCDISEPALFHQVRHGFIDGLNFMKIAGNVHLFLNQNYETDIISLFSVSNPENCQLKENFGSMISDAFEDVISKRGKCNKTFVISGNKNTGKRDIARFCTLRAIQLAKPKNANWFKKLMAADRLFQALGDTDGFLRRTELQMMFPHDAKPVLLGAVCKAVGLDKTRVTNGPSNMFPVFFNLVAGAIFFDQDMAKTYNIGNYQHYTYLNRNESVDRFEIKKCKICAHQAVGATNLCRTHNIAKHGGKECSEESCEHMGVGDDFCEFHGTKNFSKAHQNVLGSGRAWLDICEDMTALNIHENQMKNIIGILASILQLGNVEFVNGKVESEEESFFGVPLERLKGSFLMKTTKIRDEVFKKERSLEDQLAVRDGLARVLYSILFGWFVATINSEVQQIEGTGQAVANDDKKMPLDKKKKKGLFGTLMRKKKDEPLNVGKLIFLESSSLQHSSSSVDDIYQNYRLERINTMFLDDLLSQNTQVLSNIDKNWTSPTDNVSPCLNLLFESVSFQSKPVNRISFRPNAKPKPSKKPKSGILQMIEDEMRSPGASDRSLARKIVASHEDHSCMINSHDNTFTVTHFSGNVKYDTTGFLKSTKSNSIPDELCEILINQSSNELVRKMMKDFRTTPDSSSNMVTLESSKKVADEMDTVISGLKSTDLQFIFSLSPNKEGIKGQFDSEYLMQQLKSSGISRMSHVLYDTCRIPFEVSQFLGEYGPLSKNIHFRSKDKYKSSLSLCKTLEEASLLWQPYLVNSKTVVINSRSKFALQYTIHLLRIDATVCMQQIARLFLARVELIRRMHAKIKEQLEDAIERASELDIKYGIAQAINWQLKDSITSVGASKLTRMQMEANLLERIKEARASKSYMALHQVIQEADALGITASDYPQIREAKEELHKLDSSLVSEEDVALLNKNFGQVTAQLSKNNRF